MRKKCKVRQGDGALTIEQLRAFQILSANLVLGRPLDKYWNGSLNQIKGELSGGLFANHV